MKTVKSTSSLTGTQANRLIDRGYRIVSDESIINSSFIKFYIVCHKTKAKAIYTTVNNKM